MGDPNYGSGGLQPSECTKIISEDFAGTVNFVYKNCAVITPNAPVAGYVAPEILGDIKHVTSGMGSGHINVNILNPAALKDGASYQIKFNASALYPRYNTLSYSIFRTFGSVTDTLERNIDSTNFAENIFSPPFDGMAVSIINDTVAVIDSLTGWLAGSSNFILNVVEDKTAQSVPWPSDYEIQFSDTFVDTTFFPPRTPVNFKIFNKTNGEYSKIGMEDSDNSNSLTPGDSIWIVEFIREPKIQANARIAWVISYLPPFFETPIPPVNGDKFQITTSKQFNTGDFFSFSTKPVGFDPNAAGNQLGKIGVVPNPYLGAAEWERRNLNSTGRGERKIDFINLPPKCVVRIYTITGALVKTLEKDSPMDNGALSWDLVTEDGMDIAYGVYIYHVDAPGVGEHIGKFAVIK
jgi:hypothetical protein